MSADPDQPNAAPNPEGAGAARRPDALFESVFDELYDLAKHLMSDERRSHTLQPTALVNEAYVRLKRGDATYQDQNHFYQVAAKTLRNLLVDHARGKRRLKRGGGAAKRLGLDDADIEQPIETMQFEPDELATLEAALVGLDAEDPRQAKVVELRFFGGRSMREIAAILGVSERSVHSDWTFAKARLRRALDAEASSGQP